MKILTAEQIKMVDALTIRLEPIESVNLMERAAKACVDWILVNIDPGKNFKIFIGPGNNGGDGLAIARLLFLCRMHVEVFMLTSFDKLSPDASINFSRLIDSRIDIFYSEENSLPKINSNDIIIDALFGTGLSRPLSGLASSLVKHINQSKATVISIDIPSGLCSERNQYEDADAIIKAHFTLTFQFPKLCFLFAENETFTGKWVVMDINLHPEAINQQLTPYYFLHKQDIQLKTRKKFAHKGTFGHALLIAGSYGKMGAAVLAARACLRAGVGLLTTRVVKSGYNIIQTAVPESMASIDPSEEYLSTLPDLTGYSAIGIGPGIGTCDYSGIMLFQLIKSIKVPLVIDADGLNLLALNPQWMETLPSDTILTPHPGEFDRLAGISINGYDRHCKQIEFSKKYKVVIVLKGSNTSITSPDGLCWFNSTGNPGMATAGSGDVLTGIILSLLAQGYNPFEASVTAVYLHGLAGDFAVTQTGKEGLIASDIINALGKAFLEIKEQTIP